MNNIMRGHLRLMILKALEHESLSGSEIISKMEQNIGWKPSCGSIYPLLKSLEKEKVTKVAPSKSAGKIIYSLTMKGKQELKLHNSNRDELMAEILKIHRMIESTYGIDLKLNEKEMSEEIRDDLKSGGIIYKYFHKESANLKKEFRLTMLSKCAETHSKEIKQIMNEAAKKLKMLRENNKIKNYQ